MVMSRKLSLLSCSSSSVNVRLGRMELKSLSMDIMSVCEESYTGKMSSTYRK